MRTTMKYFAVLVSMAGAMLVAQSCAPDGPPTAPELNARVTQQKLEDLQNKYGWIGKYHTDGLAYIYSQLAKGSGKPRSHAEVCRIVAKATKEFHKSARHGDVPANFVDPSLMSETCPADVDTRPINKTIISSAGGSFAPRSDLSWTAVNLINQITYIAGNSLSRYDYVTGIQNVESQATMLPPDEAGAVIAVGSVALSSVDYWEANLSAWVTLPGMGTAYALNAPEATSATVGASALPLAPRNGKWWQNPYVRGFGKVLGADAIAAGRTIYVTWAVGPVGWDAAAAGAVWASGATAISLLF